MRWRLGLLLIFVFCLLGCDDGGGGGEDTPVQIESWDNAEIIAINATYMTIYGWSQEAQENRYWIIRHDSAEYMYQHSPSCSWHPEPDADVEYAAVGHSVDLQADFGVPEAGTNAGRGLLIRWHNQKCLDERSAAVTQVIDLNEEGDD
jgi:hypothetical protein